MSTDGLEPKEPVESHPVEEFTPRGILVFLTVMLVVYAVYWAYLWFVVTIQRGIGA